MRGRYLVVSVINRIIEWIAVVGWGRVTELPIILLRRQRRIRRMKRSK